MTFFAFIPDVANAAEGYDLLAEIFGTGFLEYLVGDFTKLFAKLLSY